MTPLGLAPSHCREALGRYRTLVAGLARSLEAGGPAGVLAGARILADELSEKVEVDALSRQGAGENRMTRVEADLFAPLVGRIRSRLEVLGHRHPGPDWLPALAEIDTWLAETDHALAEWETRTH